MQCAMQYPYEQSEGGRYYSGYDDTVHEGLSYTGYSIWVRLHTDSSLRQSDTPVVRILSVLNGHGKSSLHPNGFPAS